MSAMTEAYMKAIKDDSFRRRRRAESHDPGETAVAIAAMSFFLACLVMAGFIAYLVRG